MIATTSSEISFHKSVQAIMPCILLWLKHLHHPSSNSQFPIISIFILWPARLNQNRNASWGISPNANAKTQEPGLDRSKHMLHTIEGVYEGNDSHAFPIGRPNPGYCAGSETSSWHSDVFGASHGHQSPRSWSPMPSHAQWCKE